MFDSEASTKILIGWFWSLGYSLQCSRLRIYLFIYLSGTAGTICNISFAIGRQNKTFVSARGNVSTMNLATFILEISNDCSVESLGRILDLFGEAEIVHSGNSGKNDQYVSTIMI